MGISFEDEDEGFFLNDKTSNTKIEIDRKRRPKPKPKVMKPKKLIDNSFKMFANEQKHRADEPAMEDDESDDGGPPDEEQQSEEGSEQGQGETMFDDDEEVQPSPGFATIEAEKEDLIYKFFRLEKKGIRCRKFNMNSDIVEMRTEFNKIKRDAELSSSLKMSKRLLIAVVSGTEFLNTRYDPLGLELDGWSENVMTNVNDGDFDLCLERLCEKYSGRMNTPPEMELMLALAGSAMMFHMTAKMFKTTKVDDGNRPPEDYPENSGEDYREEMRGPSMNVNQLGGLFNMPQSTRIVSAPEETLSISSELSEIEVPRENAIREVSFVSEGGTRSRMKSALKVSKENTISL